MPPNWGSPSVDPRSSSRAGYSHSVSGSRPPSSRRSAHPYSHIHSERSTRSTAHPVTGQPGLTECPDLTHNIHLLDGNTVAQGGCSGIYVGNADLNWGRAKVAIKVIRVQGRTDDPRHFETLQRRLRRESKLWYGFRHRNIIELYGLARHDLFPNAVPGLVFPWCDNGSVLQFVRRNPGTKRIPLIHGVASGLKYIHGRDAVHGDLKSANILMSDDEPLRPLITDFGCAKFLGVKGYTTDLKTSMMYLSPEIMDMVGAPYVDRDGNKKGGTPTTPQSDVWAFGLVGAEIVGGSEVFHHVRELQLPSYIAKGGRPKREHFPNISPEADAVWPLLQLCWNEKSDLRPTMESVLLSLS